jgi:glutamate transport system substrate-binding protein
MTRSRQSHRGQRGRYGAALALTLVFAVLLAACGKDSDTASTNIASTAPVATAVTVAGSPTFDKIKARGKIIIGVKDDQPNLGYKDPTTGTYSGFDISTANYIASQLGYTTDKIEYKAIPSANREQAIVNGDIDYYVGTYSITDKRKDQISFAGPYYIAGQDLLVKKDDTSITGPDTLAGNGVDIDPADQDGPPGCAARRVREVLAVRRCRDQRPGRCGHDR